MTDVRVVLVTCPHAEAAAGLARTLVEERLAACGNLLPGLRSIYRWEGEVQDEPEVLLLPSYLYLARCAGPNDGLVPAESQRWGEVLATVQADHWAQIGWSSRFDARACYVQLFELLRARGH